MSKKGFTLLEMLLVLGIISVVIIIAVRYFQQGAEASKVSDATSKIRRIIEASYDWEKIHHTFADLTEKTLIDSNLLSNSDIAFPWGGSFVVRGASDYAITIAMPSLPSSVCYVFKDSLNNQNVNTSFLECNSSANQQQYVIYPKDAQY